MLQSVSRLQAFPLERVRGFINRTGRNIIPKECRKDCVDAYQRDTYTNSYKRRGILNWLQKKWITRIVFSFLLLNIVPAIYFLFVFIALEKLCFFNLFNFVFIFWAAFGVFGFYRIYHVLISVSLNSQYNLFSNLFCDVISKLEKDGTSFDGWANFLWALFYLVPPIFYLNYFIQIDILRISFVSGFLFSILICFKCLIKKG